MRKLTLSYFIILITVLISIIAIPVLAQENEVEKALLEFNNKFLPGVDNYQTQIKYPKSSDYYFKWASLVIAVGGDTAFILTAGRSETVVKIVDATVLGGKVVKGEVAEAAVNFAVGEAVDYGLKKAVGKKIPGYRSGVAVYGILKAGEEEQEKVFESIAKQREIQEFIGEIAPAAVELQKKIKSIGSPDKRKEYQEMLSAMLQKKAELSVYREMQFDKNEANIGGLEYEILYSINPAMAAQFADGKLTSSWQLSNSANDYAAGRINKYQLIEHIKNYMRSNHGNEPLSYTESMMDKRLKAIQRKLAQLDKAYEAINKYGGSRVGDIKEVSSYKQLKIVIPKAYRMVANLDIRKLVMVPNNFKSSEPNQGTTVIQEEETLKKTYALRDIGPAGGYIFYDKGSYSDGWRYLEAAPVFTEWTDKEWGSYGAFIRGTKEGIGTGRSNTTTIVVWLNSHGETGCVAQLCDALKVENNGVTYSDWFLPSRDELNLMYESLECFGVGDFVPYLSYWSSTEAGVDYVYCRDFYYDIQFVHHKTKSTIRIRAIRAF